MSIQAMLRVMEESEARSIERLVLLIMANRAGGDHDECFASVGRLSFEARVDHRTVQRCIARLMLSGDLEPNGIHPEYRTNIYRVMPQEGVAESHPPGIEGTPAPPKQELTTTERKNPKARAAPTRPTEDQTYLAGRLTETWGLAPKHLGPAALQKLNTRYGVDAVTSAMRSLRGFPPEEAVQTAYAYIEAICKGEAA